MGIRWARKEPMSVRCDREGTAGHERAEFAVARGIIGAVGAAASAMLVDVIEVSPPQSGMESAVENAGHGPSGAMAREAARHGAPVAEEQNVGGIE